MDPSEHASTFVYIGNSKSNDIAIFLLNNENGQLSLVNKVEIPDVIKPGISTPICVSPDRRFMYVISRGNPLMISSFAIQAKSGNLKYLGKTSLNQSIAYIAIDKTGRHLIGASYPHHKIIVCPISQSGIVLKQKQTLEDYPNAHSVIVDKTNNHVFVSTLGNDRIFQFKFNSLAGELEANNKPFIQLKANTGPRHLIFHPNEKFAYVIGEYDASIHVFDVDLTNGLLKEKQSVGTLPSSYNDCKAAADIHVTPNGRFIYSSERDSSTISGFKVNSCDGTLELIEVIKTEESPRGFNIDSSSKYLFIVGQLSNQMSIYKIDELTGALSKLASYSVGESPDWIEIVNLPFNEIG